MKKLIASILLAALLLSMFAACSKSDTDPAETSPVTESSATQSTGGQETTPTTGTTLEQAAQALQALYADAQEITGEDYQRVSVITVDGHDYAVTWSVDVAEELVKIVVGEDGTVTVDVNELAATEVPYILSATVTDDGGNSHTLTWNHILPAAIGADMLSIIDAAYALEEGAALPNSVTLIGVITSIDNPYSEDYQNITVTIAVPGREDKPIQCFRLKGEGASTLAIGDTITVTGTLKNYYGTVEFDAGCSLDNVVSGGNVTPTCPETAAEIVAAAFALAPGESLPYNATLTGRITSVDYAWSDTYGNITVTMYVEGKYIQCFRLKGDGAQNLGINDTITVTGVLTNYNGTIEFGSGCVLDYYTDNPAPSAPSDPLAIIDAAYQLEDYETLPYSCSLTGVISSVDYAWSDTYGNITVTIKVSGRESKPIQCYRLSGDGASELKVGDTITVQGTLKNYMGTIEFDSGCKLLSVVKGAAVSAPSDPLQILSEAYALSDYESLPYSCTLTGVISKVDTPWDESYGNITVTIRVSGGEDKPIMCYRLKGTGADTLAVGDTITVTGTIKNYMGTIEFTSGCTLGAVVKGEGSTEEELPGEDIPGEEVTAPADPAQIVDEAYALESGAALPYQATLTGKITAVNTPYNSSYQNITVTIAVEGKESQPIVCYRLKGDGADTLAVDDTITVTGNIKNYNGTIEFDSGCTLDAVVKGGNEAAEAPSDPAQIVADAYALAEGEALPYNAVLTGTITSIDSAYDANYKNITVTIVVAGCEDAPIVCFRMKGDGADTLAAGDVITVTGSIKNYYGTVEFDSGCTFTIPTGEETPDAPAIPEDPTEPEEPTDPTEPEDPTDPTEPEEPTDPTEPEEPTDPTEPEEPTDPTEPEEPTDPIAILQAAYALEEGASLDYEATLTGLITSVDSAYNASYGNITVTVCVEGAETMPVVCFRLTGDGVDTLAVGDTITVTGQLINYYGTVEFASGCTLDAVVKGENEAPTAPEDPAQIVADAYALAEGTALPYSATLTGSITSVDTAYDATYKNITVTIVVEGCEDFPIVCFRMKGDGADALAVGDTVTVTGSIKNYYGTVEFDSGCSLDTVVKGDTGSDTTPDETPEETPGDESVTPEENTAYKLGMVQSNLGQTLYITGNAANRDYYLETTDDISAAIDVYVENVADTDGGYRLYFVKDGSKTYIDIYLSGTHVNIRLTETPSAVFYWNETYSTFTATVTTSSGDAEYYLGTYGTYNTLSASKLTYIATSFPATLYIAE